MGCGQLCKAHPTTKETPRCLTPSELPGLKAALALVRKRETFGSAEPTPETRLIHKIVGDIIARIDEIEACEE
jgi:hypothetical protein